MSSPERHYKKYSNDRISDEEVDPLDKATWINTSDLKETSGNVFSENPYLQSIELNSQQEEYSTFGRRSSLLKGKSDAYNNSDLIAEDADDMADSAAPSSSQSERDVCMPIEPVNGFQDQDGINFNALNNYCQENEGYKTAFSDTDDDERIKPPDQSRKYSVCDDLKLKSKLLDQCRAENPTGRLSFFRALKPQTIHVANFSDLLNEEETFGELFSPEHGTWWLDVMSPSDEEMEMLAAAFMIHPLTVEDITMQETREKVEIFKNYLFVIFQSFRDDPCQKSYMEPLNMYIISFRHGILTFHFENCPHPANVRRRIRRLRDFVQISAEWISYALIDDITDAFIPKIRQLEQKTDAIEENVLLARSDESGTLLQQIMGCRRKVTEVYRLLNGKIDVIKMFAKRCNSDNQVALTSEIGLFLGDIQDHLLTMTSSLVQFERTLSRTLSNYLAYLSVDAIRGNNRINATLGRLTIIGTILVPLNVITGLFGMNVRVPGQFENGNNNSFGWFFGIVGVLVLFSITFLLASRKVDFS